MILVIIRMDVVSRAINIGVSRIMEAALRLLVVVEVVVGGLVRLVVDVVDSEVVLLESVVPEVVVVSLEVVVLVVLVVLSVVVDSVVVVDVLVLVVV
jgi:hypothetical protein